MREPFVTKICGGSSSYEMGLGFQFVDQEDLFLAFFDIKPPSDVTHQFDEAKDVKIDIRPTGLEYEDGSHTGVNISGFIDKKCVVEEFRGRPFTAYYNPYRMDDRGTISIDLA